MERIEDAMDFVNNRLSVDDVTASAVRPSIPADSANTNLLSQDHQNANVSTPMETGHAPDSKSNILNGETAAQIPSELIAHCVATMLMIQVKFYYILNLLLHTDLTQTFLCPWCYLLTCLL